MLLVSHITKYYYIIILYITYIILNIIIYTIYIYIESEREAKYTLESNYKYLMIFIKSRISEESKRNSTLIMTQITN
jgi:hypothetical protein